MDLNVSVSEPKGASKSLNRRFSLTRTHRFEGNPNFMKPRLQAIQHAVRFCRAPCLRSTGGPYWRQKASARTAPSRDEGLSTVRFFKYVVAGPHDSGSEVVWRICFIFSVYLIPCINIHSVNTHNHFVRIGAGQGKGGEGQGRGKGRAGQGRAGQGRGPYGGLRV